MDRALIEVKNLNKHFHVKRGTLARNEWLRAVNGINFEVKRNRVFSIVGESGCGKSTVARLLLRLIEPTSGNVLFRGNDVFDLKGERLRAFRRSVQIIFQDPFASLNPRRTVYQTISEPIKIHGLASGQRLKEKVVELLKSVGLEDVLNRYPHEFSGGQRQRICIARALAVSPEVIIADEPLSALDVSIQAQIMNLMMKIKEQSGISYIFISHDLRIVEYLSDEVAVMYLGSIVEQAKAEDLFAEPRHPYTKVLLESAPSLKPGATKKTLMEGEVPSPVNMPPGCTFHPRCPRRFEPCDKIVPQLLAQNGRAVACHLWDEKS
jgi:oligopeptide/dipeptide ABC transporter ATP-binding protein